jgi:Replicative DNA helicase
VSKSPFERIPPHSLEAERAVLGACLLDRDSLLLVTETLAGEDFYDTRHRLAFEVVLDMARKDKPVDPLTIWEEISRREMADRLGGQGFIAGARRYRADDCQCRIPRAHRPGQVRP